MIHTQTASIRTSFAFRRVSLYLPTTVPLAFHHEARYLEAVRTTEGMEKMPKLSEPMKNALRYLVLREMRKTGYAAGRAYVPRISTFDALVRRGLVTPPVYAENGLDVIEPYSLTVDGWHMFTLEGIAEHVDEGIFAEKYRETMGGWEPAPTNEPPFPVKPVSEVIRTPLTEDGLLTNAEIAAVSGGDPFVAALMRKLAPTLGLRVEDPPADPIGKTLAPFADEVKSTIFDEALNAILAGEGADHAPKEEDVHQTAGRRSERAEAACSILRDAIEFLIPGHGELVNHGHDYGTRLTFCTNLSALDVPHTLCMQAALIKVCHQLGDEWGGIATQNVEGYLSAAVYTAEDAICRGGAW